MTAKQLLETRCARCGCTRLQHHFGHVMSVGHQFTSRTELLRQLRDEARTRP